ncbi:MAG: hypothetical protein QOG65_2823 [Actinomycetota bacterium]|nr:hypothetical protein [Actinomycetota bacterium]MDQ1385444.1 hypothetical protein [Actinomycetota bacterium]
MRRIAIVFAAAGVAFVAAAAPAWAHVKVEPESAAKGSDAVLAFVVPNEKTNATTNKVVVQFPTDHPIAEAQTAPIPGWTAEVTTAPVKTPIKTDAGTVNDAVRNVTWTAAGPGIGVDQFQEFRVSVGLPADADSLTFPTTQTYTDGETVNWVQVTPPGGPEPDSPAPVLTLTNGASTADTTPTTTAPTDGTAAASNVKKSDVDSAKTIAIIGIVVGAIGLVAGIGGLTMARRRSS